MSAEVVTAVVSLGGVALGGLLSFVVQHSATRTAVRAEQQKQAIALAETRRAERLAHLERYVTCAAAAERVAFSRPAEWGPGDEAHDQAQLVMQQMWVVSSLLQVVFPDEVHAAAEAYGRRLNRAVWDGVPDLEAFYPQLDEVRHAFLVAARAALG
jgi:hypothetical protein